jgi:8-amino-3,8-dideoxy-alpha-D-manno-octulosonate transaminase
MMPGNELIGQEEINEVLSVFNSGGVLFGHGFEQRRNGCYKVREFEEKLTRKFNSNAACCSSGTAALYVSLKILGITYGDYVAVQYFNFIASVEAVVACGAIPIIINIDDSLNMCPQDLGEKFKQYKFKAVIATDMQGNPADYDHISSVCKKNNSFLIEDACQAIGGKYKGKYLGTFGDIGVFSLDYGKTITTGEGGVIFTNDEYLHRMAKAFIDHGHANEVGIDRGNDSALICGFNLRMSELEAAVGIAQLGKLDFIVDRYHEHMQLLERLINRDMNGVVAYRKINDKDYLKDGLILFVNREVEKDLLTNKMKEYELSFKNVPNAIRWHSAEYWQHI